VPEGADKAKLKVHFHMNLNGLVTLTSATAITEVEEEVPVTATSGPAAAAAADGGDTPMAEGGAAPSPAAADGPAPMEAEASPAPEAAAAPPAVEKKKKVVKSSVPVASAGVCGYTTKQLNDFMEKEGQMAAADKLQEDTNEARNALESYIFELRRRLYEDLAPFVQEVRGGVLRGCWS
jgi:heat shock protein 4